MKTLLNAALASAIIFGAGSAVAADLPYGKALPMAPALPSFYNWTGAYVGAQLGYSWGQDTTTELLTANRAFINAFDYHPDSAFGGVHAGFNYQMGSFVVGIEGDIDLMNARSGFHDPSLVRSPTDPGGLVRAEQDWQASIRARFGFAFDRVMIYATGGVAFSEFKYAYHNPLAGFGEGGSFSRTGWTVGGGVNYALTNNLILGVDYRYTDYGKFDYVANSAFLGLTAEQSPVTHQVRASLAYKF